MIEGFNKILSQHTSKHSIKDENKEFRNAKRTKEEISYFFIFQSPRMEGFLANTNKDLA